MHHPVSADDSRGGKIRDCFSWTSEGIRLSGTRLGRRDQMEGIIGREEGVKKEKEVRQKKAEENKEEKQKRKD